MAKYKIEQDHEGCISCGTCVSVCGSNWKMGSDGKASPKKTDIDEKDFKCNMDAAKSCPAGVIHIINNETKEKLK